MKVQIESPWKYSGGGMGKGLIENPPEGVKYFFKNQKKIVSDERELSKMRRIKKILILISKAFPLIKKRKVSLIKEEIDLIHCEHFLCDNKKISWVSDVEGFWQFFIGKRTKIKKNKIKNILLRENCKKIIFWTEHAKKEAEKEFPLLKNKFDFLYPAINIKKFKKSKKKNITLLFVGRSFYEKGGFHALVVLDKLTKKFNNVDAIYAGEIPENFRKKYSKNSKIKILGMVNHKKLMKEVYPSSDLLIYPGYHDSFGFAYLEAMSFGIPIVTTKRYNTEEIVENEKTGFLINYDEEKIKINRLGFNEKKLIGSFCDKISKLIENKRLREKMSKNCLKEIKFGNFSIKKRNKKLKEIYEEVLR